MAVLIVDNAVTVQAEELVYMPLSGAVIQPKPLSCVGLDPIMPVSTRFRFQHVWFV
jgi:hypothetical protein